MHVCGYTNNANYTYLYMYYHRLSMVLSTQVYKYLHCRRYIIHEYSPAPGVRPPLEYAKLVLQWVVAIQYSSPASKLCQGHVHTTTQLREYKRKHGVILQEKIMARQSSRM